MSRPSTLDTDRFCIQNPPNDQLALAWLPVTPLTPPRVDAGVPQLAAPTAIERPSRLAAAAVEQLRTLIFNGQLPPGTVLRQEELAGRLGISRTPLRESLLLLEAEGLVETTPSGASRVVDLRGQAAREALELREVVDGLVARLNAERGLAVEQLGHLEEMLAEMDRASRADDKQAYLAINARFHLELLAHLEHRWLDQLTVVVRLSSQATYLSDQPGGERLRRSAGEHRAILTAIREGRAEKAEELARAHVRNASTHWVGKEPKSL